VSPVRQPIALSLPLVLVLAALAGPGSVAAQGLTIVNNGGSVGDAQRVAFFEPFTEATGIAVAEDAFNQELARIRSQVETGNLIWDVASVTAINDATGCEEGLFEPVDWSAHLDPADFDGVGGLGACGVPNNFVSGGLVYDGDVYGPDEAPTSWADFWDVEQFPGKRALLYRAEQTMEVALMADGVPPSEVMDVLATPEGVERAFAKIEELKPHIVWWRSGAESMQLLLTGEAVMGYGWNGRVADANQSNDRNLKIAFEAGHVSGSQYFAVMKGTPNLEAAIDFITFASSPERQADYATRIMYAPANSQAYALMAEEAIATLPSDHLHLASFQSGELYLNFWLDNGDSLLERFVTMTAQ
jgi:putative spermidine/putrescine transport system substrate-binding protein